MAVLTNSSVQIVLCEAFQHRHVQVWLLVLEDIQLPERMPLFL